MMTLPPATYALHRQKRAVERALQARSHEDMLRAARWAGAWHRLVQRMLDRQLMARPAQPSLVQGWLQHAQRPQRLH
jgi:hypothetical protein